MERVGEPEQRVVAAAAADELQPDGQAVVGVPHGTEIAGSPVTVIVQHDAIQSR